MTKREVIRLVLDGGAPPYVPWQLGFTLEARDTLRAHYGVQDLDAHLDNHLLPLGGADRLIEDLGGNQVRDFFGVIWDRSVDRDIGIVANRLLPEPTLAGYAWPDPRDPRIYAEIPTRIAAYGDRWRVFEIGFSLYERRLDAAWYGGAFGGFLREPRLRARAHGRDHDAQPRANPRGPTV
jgi:uroporphyrinogen decarboxylase